MNTFCSICNGLSVPVQWTLWMKMSTLRVISSQYTIFPTYIWVCMLDSIGYVAWIMYIRMYGAIKTALGSFWCCSIYTDTHSIYVCGLHVSLTWNIESSSMLHSTSRTFIDRFVHFIFKSKQWNWNSTLGCVFDWGAFYGSVLHQIDNISQILHQIDQLISTIYLL